ncbi:methylornithine synthase PylB [uncultured Ilyobacter sp.]|uniref:methylornithine synthase PylB n=1 Tax=uncultured Ilyobacter sp. TaxID=544433 RepID=UPI0029C0EB54|nr:methylornithine synthase PylB [uncultured Ilyobacter sp.]
MLDYILNKCLQEDIISDDEIIYLLNQREKGKVEKIFSVARKIREKYFGSKIFLYGFVYFSTYCKNDCNFCFYRKSNSISVRYRKKIDEIVETARQLKEDGIHLIDLTMGEDKYFIDHPEYLVEMVKAVKSATDLPVMISFGVITKELVDMMADSGADWYALYQETHNKELFKKLRKDQSYDERMEIKKYAKSKGILIEEGLLTGVGNKVEDTAHSFEVMKSLGASQIRTMTFVPQEGAPTKEQNETGYLSELLNIAVMRILFPNVLIPASLDVDGLRGLEERLMAGANVVTSIIPPHKGFAGVANSETDIEEGYRTIEGIQETLKKCGLKQADVEDYKAWVNSRKEMGNIKIENINYRCKTTGIRSRLSS